MLDDSALRLVYLALLGGSLTLWLIVEFRKNLSGTLKTMIAWGLIFLGVMAAYGLWGDISRGTRPVQQVSGQEVTLPRADDGHYYARLEIGGKTVEFMVDTGATDVVLTPKDAKRVGIDPASLAYIGQAATANGVVRTARVRLPEVRFGPFVDQDVGVSVNDAPMETSLLGMDYLGQFQISIAGDRMVLRR